MQKFEKHIFFFKKNMQIKIQKMFVYTVDFFFFSEIIPRAYPSD